MVDHQISASLPTPVLLLMPTKHMGNLLVALASVAALARAAQGRSLVVLDHSYQDIAAAVPGLGPILYFPRHALSTGPIGRRLAATWTLVRELRRFDAELLIDLDGLRTSGWLSRLARARVKTGSAAAQDSRAYSQLLPPQRSHPHRFHDYAAYCRHWLGVAPTPGYAAFARVPADGLLRRVGVRAAAPLVSIHVGATKDYKQWPARHFAQLADWLVEQGFQVALIGAGRSDGERIAQVLGQCRRQMHNLHNQLRLSELIALFQASRFFVGNDSGPMHLAAAAGIPVFALFGPTDAARWGPLGANAQVIRHAVACAASCSRRRCDYDRRCLRTLSPDVVIRQLKQAIDALPAESVPIAAREECPLRPVRDVAP